MSRRLPQPDASGDWSFDVPGNYRCSVEGCGYMMADACHEDVEEHVLTEHAASASVPPLDTLLDAATESIDGAPGMHVAEYGASMVGRKHAVDVVRQAIARAYAAASEPSR